MIASPYKSFVRIWTKLVEIKVQLGYIGSSHGAGFTSATR